MLGAAGRQRAAAAANCSFVGLPHNRATASLGPAASAHPMEELNPCEAVRRQAGRTCSSSTEGAVPLPVACTQPMLSSSHPANKLGWLTAARRRRRSLPHRCAEEVLREAQFVSVSEAGEPCNCCEHTARLGSSWLSLQLLAPPPPGSQACTPSSTRSARTRWRPSLGAPGTRSCTTGTPPGRMPWRSTCWSWMHS